MNSLTSNQIQKLIFMTSEFVQNTRLKPPLSAEKEPAYTSRVVLPLVSAWVKSLNENGLHVRGDGGLNPLKIVWDEISLYPDITIMHFHDRLISFEVKFLRNDDPGGSLTKAIGQTYMYEKAGFQASFGVIVDCRTLNLSSPSVESANEIELTKSSRAYIFKPSDKPATM